MAQQQRGPGTPEGDAEPGLNISTPADRSGLANTTTNSFAQLAALDDLRLQRGVERLHRLGARPLYELFIELGKELLIRSEIAAKVMRYAQLDPDIVRSIGADQFPSRPVHVVPR
jgi:hypothetical protein